jgi:hypothetical protein
MGGAASSSNFSGGVKGYADKAAAAKQLPDKILSLMFSKADFRDLLTLSNIDTCPRYVFTSAKSLESLFRSIRVRPERGAEGEYMFAPIKSLSPDVLRDAIGQGQAAAQGRLDQLATRDAMCVDVAYYYVRIFQIYAAVALTILNTNPTRPYAAVAAQQQQKQQASLFTGGARPTKIATTTEAAINRSVFAPLLNNQYFGAWTGASAAPTGTTLLELRETNQNVTFLVAWTAAEISNTSMDLNGTYSVTNRTSNASSDHNFVISMVRNENEIVMSINGTPVVIFVTRGMLGTWGFYQAGADPTRTTTSLSELVRLINDYCKVTFIGAEQGPGPGQGQGQGPGQGPGRSTSYTSSGPSSFESFQEVEKMYKSLFNGEIGAPKAYAVARAMTLMNPIFDFEKSYKDQPVACDACRTTSRLDFETSSDYMMPRPGKSPKGNIYLRSFVTLFYDKFEIQRDGLKRKLIFSKSNPGNEQLRKASTLMARLYNITMKPEEFLESTTSFVPFKKLCGDSADGSIFYKDPQVKEQVRKIIGELLALQEEHNKRANDFLKSMFTVVVDPKEGESLKFTEALKGKGIQSVNEFGEKARSMLLDYYLKSEGLYVKAILLLEAARNAGRA